MFVYILAGLHMLFSLCLSRTGEMEKATYFILLAIFWAVLLKKEDE